MKWINILCLLLCTSLLACKPDCSDTAGKELMGDWYKKKIRFPGQMKLLTTNSTIQQKDSIVLNDARLYVLHFFTADCDECINILRTAQKFIDKHKEDCRLKYIFIASGPSDFYAAKAIRESGFKLPVYYEKNYYSFKKLNNLPLDDKMYDTMLIDQEGQLLLFGGFFNNEKAEKLLNSIVNCHQCQ